MRFPALVAIVALSACTPDAPELNVGARRVLVRNADGGSSQGGTTRDGGTTTITDAGAFFNEDGGFAFDAGVVDDRDAGAACPAACKCIVRFDSSGGGVFVSGFEFVCCATLCLGGDPTAYRCDENGVLHRLDAKLVCR
jgi:hypothetical protein